MAAFIRPISPLRPLIPSLACEFLRRPLLAAAWAGEMAAASGRLPERNSGYLDAGYWDERFQTEEEYDW